MDRTNRWLGLAIVGLLALVAQPAALTQAPMSSVGDDEPTPSEACSTPADIDRDRLDELTGDVAVVHPEPPAPCLDDANVSAVTEDALERVGHRLS